jgi:hypothetical protein
MATHYKFDLFVCQSTKMKILLTQMVSHFSGKESAGARPNQTYWVMSHPQTSEMTDGFLMAFVSNWYATRMEPQLNGYVICSTR